jgi:hypothetical protein
MTVPTRSARIGNARGSGGNRRAHQHLLIALAVSLLFGVTFTPSALANQDRVQAVQQLAVLLNTHRAHRAPQADSPEVAMVSASRPITGEQTTLPVIGRSTDANGATWLHVMLPGRPNGSVGWITQSATHELMTHWHIVVDLAAREVIVYNDGRTVRAFHVVVGKPSTPTPTGRFFVEEAVQMPPGQAGGPLALALSARSDVLQTFEGGPGQIGIHGVENLGGRLGAAESHGCVRMANASIRWLAARIDPGVPVTIEANRKI